jgi:hypothetical protein
LFSPFECNENQIESHLLLWEQQATNLRLTSASQRGAEAPPEPAELVSALRLVKWIGGEVDRKVDRRNFVKWIEETLIASKKYRLRRNHWHY